MLQEVSNPALEYPDTSSRNLKKDNGAETVSENVS
jgi:hypothetical protein